MRVITRLAACTAAVVAAAGMGLATAGATLAQASAAQGTAESAGYSFAGHNAHFRYVGATVTLPDPAKYAASIKGGLSQSVQLWRNGRAYVLTVSSSPGKTAWSPDVRMYNTTTHALACAASLGNCPPGSGGFEFTAASYPVGHTVHLSLYYNQATGGVVADVQDVTSSMAFTDDNYTIMSGTGLQFTRAVISTEFGASPWSMPSSYTPPASILKTAGFTGGALTNYLGQRYGLIGYWTDTPLVMTAGAANPNMAFVQAAPGVITGNGFATYLEPAS
jgi:phage tail protein X